MSQQQNPSDISIDQIPIDIPNAQTSGVDPGEVPEEIQSITRGLASEHPPTNPLVVLKAARWWYIHGKSGTDPAFQWAIEWTRYLAIDVPSDIEQCDEFLEYLTTLGFADEKQAFR